MVPVRFKDWDCSLGGLDFNRIGAMPGGLGQRLSLQGSADLIPTLIREVALLPMKFHLHYGTSIIGCSSSVPLLVQIEIVPHAPMPGLAPLTGVRPQAQHTAKTHFLLHITCFCAYICTNPAVDWVLCNVADAALRLHCTKAPCFTH